MQEIYGSILENIICVNMGLTFCEIAEHVCPMYNAFFVFVFSETMSTPFKYFHEDEDREMMKMALIKFEKTLI